MLDPSGNRTAAKLLRSKHSMYEDVEIPIHLFISSGSAGRVPFYAAIGLWSSLWDNQALRAQTVENAHIEADTPSASPVPILKPISVDDSPPYVAMRGEGSTQYWMSTPLKMRQRSSIGSVLRSRLHSTKA